MYTEKTKYKKHHIKKISLLLTIAMIFSLVSFTPKSEVHAASASTVDMSAVSGDVTITRDAINISASTPGGVVTTGTAEEGIDITGTTTEYKVSISGQGSGGENINVTLDNLSITIDGPIQLEDSANVKMSLKKENTLDSSDDNNINPGLRVSSPNAISIGGEGKLTAKGYIGAGIGGQGISGGTDQIAENGDNITIEDSVSVTAIGYAGAGIGGGGANGDPENPTYGGSENIIIKGNAEVKAHSDIGAGVGGGGICSRTNGYPKAKEANNIQIFGDAVVDAQGLNGAGIGGGYLGSGSDIRISGNAVVDAQGNYGAGIGGGTGGSGSDIRISGNAVVDAQGSAGAGIGGGYFGSGSDIGISGNVVVDAQSNDGSGIGGGHKSSGSNISISGGFVTSKGNNGDDIGNGAYGSGSSNITITGGSLYAVNNKISDTPTDGNGDDVYKVTVPAVQNETEDSLKGNMDTSIPLSGSGIYKAKTISSGACEHGDSFPSDSAVAYVYLPAGNYEDISVGQNDYGFSDVVSGSPSAEQNRIYWESHEISFDKNTGDEISFTTKSAIKNKPYGELPIATKAGYTFKGWFTEQSGGNQVKSDTAVKTPNDHNLYAHFEKIHSKFTVTLNPNGGKVKNNKITVTNESKYGSLATPDRTGYSFKGWFTSKSGGTKITTDTTVDLTKDQTLYAQWTANKYKVTFMGNKGKIKKSGKYKTSKLTKTKTFGTKYGTLPKAKRTGYKFKGWYTKKSGGKKVTKNTVMKSTKNIKLYARWTPNGKITNCKWVHLRKGPGNSKIVKGYIKKGTKVSIIEKKEVKKHTWYKVKVDGKTGYIYSKYIKRV